MVQAAPAAGDWVAAELGQAEREAGAAACRAMAAAALSGDYPAVPGAHCAICPHLSDCPAHTPAAALAPF